MKISAAIITLNEEKRIAKALDSLDWVDEIVVVDSGSDDRTREIAESKGAKVVHQDWLGFGRQKQIAVDQCSNDWILSIDADEWVSNELKEEIKNVFSGGQEPNEDGFYISRETVYMNRVIRHSGWFPDYNLRLFRKSKGRWKDMEVHESVKMHDDSKTSRLKGRIGHITVDNALEHYRMIGERYAPLGAEQMAREGKTVTAFGTAISFPLEFLRSYLLRRGILDGFPGFCIALFAAYNAFLKRLLRYESQNNAPDDKMG